MLIFGSPLLDSFFSLLSFLSSIYLFVFYFFDGTTGVQLPPHSADHCDETLAASFSMNNHINFFGHVAECTAVEETLSSETQES